MRKILAIALAFSTMASTVHGREADTWSLAYKPFKGEYWLYSGTLIDRDAPTRIDRKISISITGSAAKEMFDSMYPDSKPTCSNQKGDRDRRKGNIYCTFSPREGYTCAVGFDLRTGASIEGMVC